MKCPYSQQTDVQTITTLVVPFHTYMHKLWSKQQHVRILLKERGSRQIKIQFTSWINCSTQYIKQHGRKSNATSVLPVAARRMDRTANTKKQRKHAINPLD